MSNVNQTANASATATATATPAPKAPSKKSLALAIFEAKMDERKAGKFSSNKDFRAAVLNAIKADLGVSTASAATMYNAAKKDAETADPTVGLGRDPKKEKAPSTGKRGRPAKAKTEAEATAPALDTSATDAVAPAADSAAPTAPAEALV